MVHGAQRSIDSSRADASALSQQIKSANSARATSPMLSHRTVISTCGCYYLFCRNGRTNYELREHMVNLSTCASARELKTKGHLPTVYK